MKILYIANIRLPTEKAHGVQIMKMCEAFSRQGNEIELLVPQRHNPLREDPFAYYGVKTRFKITYLPVFDTVSYGRLGFLFESFVFARRAARYIRTIHPDLIYGRDELVLRLLPRNISAKLIWESHTGSWNYLAQALAQRAYRIVVISQGLKDFYLEQGIKDTRILVAHDGVDLGMFSHPEDKSIARNRLALPQDCKIALYVGRLDGWKGVEALMNAGDFLPSDIRIAIIGGESPHIETLKEKYPKIIFLGFRPYRQIADNEAAADVLVLPTTGQDLIGARFTSPLKLFTYLASGKPIVAADLPSIREVLDDNSAILVSPDNPKSFAEGIQKALLPESRGLVKNASAKAASYTWEDRALKILTFVTS